MSTDGLNPAALGSFLDRLGALPGNDRVFNPWRMHDSAGVIRRHNLELYLTQLHSGDCQLLFLGEAPGYQGCRRSGIPFTSEPIMLRGSPSLDLLGEASGYRRPDPHLPIRQEPSATIVWQTLLALQIRPLLWSAFPWHPHRPGEPDSNRPPTRQETASGHHLLIELIALMRINQFVAVGNVAAATFAALDIEAPKVRHPAQGGKNDFVRGLNELFGTPESTPVAGYTAEQ